MSDDEDRGRDDRQRFERLAMPHLDAAYNLARWLTRDDDDARDVVQDAFMRAMRYIGGFRGDNPRGWVLQIVRHTCFTWLKENRPAEMRSLDEDDDAIAELPGPVGDDPHVALLRRFDRQQIDRAIAALPIAYREVFVLRELEDLAYADIARIAGIPIGTVMSRLSRARGLMREALIAEPRPILRAVPVPNRVRGGERS